MVKPTKRKAFNFLRSYFDVFNEIPTDKDKLEFLTSIINKQFLDEDPKGLGFISNLCYESQRHQIESSVNGWKRANKDTPLTTLGTNPPTTPRTDPKEEEVQEEVQEEEKEKVQVKEKGEKVYSKEVNDCFDNCLNYFEKHLHPKNKDKWLDTIDKLNRLDKIPFELIEKITRQTREDDFWRTNFMSLTKLRQTQKSSGLKYIVVFNEKLKNNGTSGKKNEQLTYEQWKAESSGKSIADQYKEWKNQ